MTAFPQGKGPLVSIVTPSFNQAEYIEENILSVMNQDYPNIEHIIVDGGSTDGTLQLLKKYGDKIKWISEPDNGQSQAINKGFKMATGEIIGWLNSDDLYEPGAVNAALAAFREDPNLGVVYGYAREIDGQGAEKRLFTCPEFSKEALYGRPNFILQPSVFMRRSSLESAGYLDEDLHYVMDYDLWLRLGRVTDFKLIPRPLAVMRFHAEAKSVANEDDFWPELLKVYAKYDEVKVSRAYIILRSMGPVHTVWRWMRSPHLLSLRDHLFRSRG